ncbi:hypothetical protein ACFXAY_30760 [Streptomyces microflavus]|uniref:LexA family protein n=1 Tax=Streptomyces microflavus TaxID=1919 RepID=UPI00331D8211
MTATPRTTRRPSARPATRSSPPSGGSAEPCVQTRGPRQVGLSRPQCHGSDRQEAIKRVIRSWIFEHGQGPTIRQIGEWVGLCSASSVA